MDFTREDLIEAKKQIDSTVHMLFSLLIISAQRQKEGCGSRKGPVF